MNRIKFYIYTVITLIIISSITTCDDTPLSPLENSDVNSSDERNLSYTGRDSVKVLPLSEVKEDIEDLYTIEQFANISQGGNTIDFSSARSRIKTDGSGTHYLFFVQGGPEATLGRFTFFPLVLDQSANPFQRGETPLSSGKWTVINVKEHQMLDTDWHTGNTAITKEQALYSTAYSAAIVFKLAKHFSQQGKKVYIMGHSFGSWVVNKMMLDYKFENYVEYVFVMGGRLTVPTTVYQSNLVGNSHLYTLETSTGFRRVVGAVFENNSSNLSGEEPSGVALANYVIRTQNTLKLTGSINQYDFVSLFTTHNIPLSGKVSFVSGKYDESVGYFSTEEITFAQTYATFQSSTTPDAGNDGTLGPLNTPHNVSSKDDYDAYISKLEPTP